MKNIYLFISLLLVANIATSQVKDISLTFSPVANYTWWSDEAGLEDDLLYGGNIGFGFGEYVELRATHLRKDGIKRDFSDFGLPLGFENIIGEDRQFDLTRWGGELKANIGTGSFNPYVTLGSGVQTIETDFDTNVDNIYVSGGLGVKIGFSDRIALILEGRNTVINANTGLSLLTENERASLGLADTFFESERLYNWSALASLQFYLGGRAPGKLSELDKTYSNKLKDGFKGFTFTFEPAASYIDFDNDTFIRDTWLLGGYLGFDFNEYLGIRGFYFQSTQDEKPFNDFDDLAMYGAELRANLNDGNGVVPYLVLGGGYINVYDSYQSIDNVAVSSSEFAKGGLGLEIPVSKYFSINASASSLLTSGQNFEDLSDNDELQTNWAYSIGLHLKLGKKNETQEDETDKLKKEDKDSKETPESDEKKEKTEEEQNLEEELDEKRRALAKTYDKLDHQERRMNKSRIDALQAYYQKEMDKLDKAYQKAINEGRLSDAVDIFEERKTLQNELDKLEKLEDLNDEYTDNLSRIRTDNDVRTDTIPVNKGQADDNRSLENDEVMEQNEQSSEDDKDASAGNITTDKSTSKEQQEKTDTKTKNGSGKLNKIGEENKGDQAVIDKLDELMEQLEENEKDIRKLDNKVSKIDRSNKKDRIISDKETIFKTQEVETEEKAKKKEVKKDTTQKKTYTRDYFNEFEYVDEEAKKKFYIADFLEYEGLSAFTGFNVGQQGTFNLGARMHYGIKDTSIEVMPELSLAISDPFSFGVAINAVHPFKTELPYNISPYAGIGTGYLYNDETSNLTGNLLIGFYTDALGGRIYVDYTNRNLFKFNQLAIGYRFKF